jgi:hypothetical protein
MLHNIAPEDAAQCAVTMSDLYTAFAVMKIDGRFGEGYAKANPALLAAFVTATAMTEAAALLTTSLATLIAPPLAAQTQAPPEKEITLDD